MKSNNGFLISEKTTNPIISIKNIVSIKYGGSNSHTDFSDSRTIVFKIIDNTHEYWSFESREEAQKEYDKIKKTIINI